MILAEVKDPLSENKRKVETQMKKLVSLLLALVMVLSLSATALAEEPVTLTIAVGQHGSDAVEDFNTKYAIAEAEKATGIHIEWIPINESNTEQVTTLLAGNLPDVFLGLLNDTLITQNASLFVPTEDLIEKYAPNIYKLYEENIDGWRTFLTFPDGHMYGLMANYRAAYGNSIDGTMWIRKDWLDNLGLAVPTTLTELEEVLVAFRDLDADNDGDATNEIPWDWCQKHYAAKYYEVIHMFGNTTEGGNAKYDIVDGKVVASANTDSFRAGLEYMHKLTSEGLLNVEGLTQTEEQYFANIANGKVGVFTGWAPYTYTSDPELQAKYVSVGPVSADGYTYRTMPTTLTANRAGFVITTACENVEAALKWWDYMHNSQAFAHAARSGPEGLTWEMIDGVATDRVYTAEDAIAFGYEELAGHVGTSTFAASMGLTNCPPLILESRFPVEGTGSYIRATAVKQYEPFFTPQVMSKGVVPTEAQEEYDFTCETLADTVDNYAAEAILNGVTEEGWNKYLSDLDNAGHDFHLEFFQKYLDGAF